MAYKRDYEKWIAELVGVEYTNKKSGETLTIPEGMLMLFVDGLGHASIKCRSCSSLMSPEQKNKIVSHCRRSKKRVHMHRAALERAVASWQSKRTEFRPPKKQKQLAITDDRATMSKQLNRRGWDAALHLTALFVDSETPFERLKKMSLALKGLGVPMGNLPQSGNALRQTWVPRLLEKREEVLIKIASRSHWCLQIDATPDDSTKGHRTAGITLIPTGGKLSLCLELQSIGESLTAERNKQFLLRGIRSHSMSLAVHIDAITSDEGGEQSGVNCRGAVLDECEHVYWFYCLCHLLSNVLKKFWLPEWSDQKKTVPSTGFPLIWKLIVVFNAIRNAPVIKRQYESTLSRDQLRRGPVVGDNGYRSRNLDNPASCQEYRTLSNRTHPQTNFTRWTNPTDSGRYERRYFPQIYSFVQNLNDHNEQDDEQACVKKTKKIFQGDGCIIVFVELYFATEVTTLIRDAIESLQCRTPMGHHYYNIMEDLIEDLESTKVDEIVEEGFRLFTGDHRFDEEWDDDTIKRTKPSVTKLCADTLKWALRYFKDKWAQYPKREKDILRVARIFDPRQLIDPGPDADESYQTRYAEVKADANITALRQAVVWSHAIPDEYGVDWDPYVPPTISWREVEYELGLYIPSASRIVENDLPAFQAAQDDTRRAGANVEMRKKRTLYGKGIGVIYEWWASRTARIRYPHLSALARRVVSLQCTSTEVERLFSTWARVLKGRHSLAIATKELLVKATHNGRVHCIGEQENQYPYSSLETAVERLLLLLKLAAMTN